MHDRTAIVNFTTTPEKRAAYAAACSSLGTTVSEICRKALDNTVSLAAKLKTDRTRKKAAQESQEASPCSP